MSEKKSLDFALKETSPDIGGGRVSGSGKLTSSFDLVEQMHFLYVRIIRARRLPPETSNPFVQVVVGNYTAATSPKADPEWTQVFAFSRDRLQAATVVITLKGKSAGDDQSVGKVSFDVHDIPTRVPPDSSLAPQWYSLEDKNGFKGERGELMLAIWLGTQADEVFPDAWLSDASAVDGESISNTRSKVYLSPKLWYLRVTLIQAQDLVSRDKNRKPEVYVRAVLGNMLLRSRYSPDRNGNPTWNEDLMFVVAEPFDDPLVLTVVDKLGNNKEDTLGRCVIPLAKAEKRLLPLPAAGAAANWYNLESIAGAEEKEDVKFASRLHLRISLDGGYHVIDESIYYTSDFRASAKLLWPPSIGVLELGILNATSLLPMKSRNGIGTTDAYCVAKYGPKWVRTRTIVDSFSPKWNEQYTWEVFEPYTVITIGIFDNGQLKGAGGSSKDQVIGKVRIRLSTLETDRVYTHSYPLIVLKPKGVQKMGEIQLAVRFTCSSQWNLLQAYTRPLFSKMHYMHPLSIHQVESLRHQATQILSSRLDLSEPPLRKEVVEYMLDSASNVWSLRKGRANLERLLANFDKLVEAWKLFDEIRQWKNPVNTIMAHIWFSGIILYPDFILPMCLFICALIGAWQYRKRPRHPPYMDATLSLADKTNADELEEEFDTFPTSCNKTDVLKRRYDRLRNVLARIMVVTGDLANQGERFRSLLSWRDPRATCMFVIFCILAGATMYIIPPRLQLLGIGFYAMRHPKFQNEMVPSLPQNFFRRLPARIDSML